MKTLMMIALLSLMVSALAPAAAEPFSDRSTDSLGRPVSREVPERYNTKIYNRLHPRTPPAQLPEPPKTFEDRGKLAVETLTPLPHRRPWAARNEACEISGAEAFNDRNMSGLVCYQRVWRHGRSTYWRRR